MATTINNDGGNNDVEQALSDKEIIESIKPSRGWNFPQVKLAYWDPENEKQWKNGGKAIATRNLIVSVPNLFCAFGVWLSWSVIASKIHLMHDADPNVYPFQDYGSPQGDDYTALLYTLPGVAGLSGATVRIANSFMTQIVGGRNVVFHSSIMITIAMFLTAFALRSPTAPFNLLLIAAWLSGTGGGAFGSSMSNMSFLYPKAQQGYALGMNGGLGNLGVSMTQLLVPIFMDLSFGKEPISDVVDGWPNHAGWFWWPACLLVAIGAYIWMSNHPNHGNQAGRDTSQKKYYNFLHYYWLEIASLLAALVAVLVLVSTRDSRAWVNNSSGQVGYALVLVIIAVILAHLALYFLSPRSSYGSLKRQAAIFHDKHTWIMTFLYTMSFGSFIGFSSAFPKLINDLFGYVTASGCYYDDPNSDGQIFVKGGTEFDCVGSGGVWGYETVTNPNAPDPFKFSWLGAFIGSVIRPFGGILADRHGGAKVTQILIYWCTLSTVCLGILVQKTAELDQPEHNFGVFVFLFLNVFFTLGAMNGTIFRSIAVLFDYELAGTVLGWSSSIAAYGAFVIPALFNVAISAGKPQSTLYGMAGYYIVCGFINWWYYGRSKVGDSVKDI